MTIYDENNIIIGHFGTLLDGSCWLGLLDDYHSTTPCDRWFDSKDDALDCVRDNICHDFGIGF